MSKEGLGYQCQIHFTTANNSMAGLQYEDDMRRGKRLYHVYNCQVVSEGRRGGQRWQLPKLGYVKLHTVNSAS